MEHPRNLSEWPQCRGIEVVTDADDGAFQRRQRASPTPLVAANSMLAGTRAATALNACLVPIIACSLAAYIFKGETPGYTNSEEAIFLEY